jgi:hypothetical protein
VGTVEVLGMPLLTSAMDRQIEETVSKNGKKKNEISCSPTQKGK